MLLVNVMKSLPNGVWIIHASRLVKTVYFTPSYFVGTILIVRLDSIKIEIHTYIWFPLIREFRVRTLKKCTMLSMNILVFLTGLIGLH